MKLLEFNIGNRLAIGTPIDNHKEGALVFVINKEAWEYGGYFHQIEFENGDRFWLRPDFPLIKELTDAE